MPRLPSNCSGSITVSGLDSIRVLGLGQFERGSYPSVILRDFSPVGSRAHLYDCKRNAYPLRARCFASSASRMVGRGMFKLSRCGNSVD